MKAAGVWCFAITVLIAGCESQQSPPIEGAWKLVHATWMQADTLAGDFPGTWTGSDMKIWSKGYFAFVGRIKIDTTFSDNFGGGLYKLEGNRYEEIIQFHTWTPAIGDTVRMFLEVKNDTLIQTWPVLSSGQIDKSNFREEKYVRLK